MNPRSLGHARKGITVLALEVFPCVDALPKTKSVTDNLFLSTISMDAINVFGDEFTLHPYAHVTHTRSIISILSFILYYYLQLHVTLELST